MASGTGNGKGKLRGPPWATALGKKKTREPPVRENNLHPPHWEGELPGRRGWSHKKKANGDHIKKKKPPKKETSKKKVD